MSKALNKSKVVEKEVKTPKKKNMEVKKKEILIHLSDGTYADITITNRTLIKDINNLVQIRFSTNSEVRDLEVVDVWVGNLEDYKVRKPDGNEIVVDILNSNDKYLYAEINENDLETQMLQDEFDEIQN